MKADEKSLPSSAVLPDDLRHLVEVAAPDRRRRVGRQHGAVGDRRDRAPERRGRRARLEGARAGAPLAARGIDLDAVEVGGRLGHQVVPDPFGALRGSVRIGRRLVGGEPILDQQRVDDRVRLVHRRGRRAAADAAAQRDGLVEEARREGRNDQGVDVRRASRLAHDRHVARVAAEVRDVVLDELQRLDEIQQGVVAGIVDRIAGVERRIGEPAEETKPVRDRHDDGVRVLREIAAEKQWIEGGADDVAAAVDVDDDGQLRCVGCARRTPDVQIEAVFRADLLVERLPDRAVVLAFRRRAEEAADLAACIGVVLGRPDARPRVGGLGRLPPQRAHGRLGEWHAAPRYGVSVRLHDALDLTEFGGANGGRACGGAASSLPPHPARPRSRIADAINATATRFMSAAVQVSLR